MHYDALNSKLLRRQLSLIKLGCRSLLASRVYISQLYITPCLTVPVKPPRWPPRWIFPPPRWIFPSKFSPRSIFSFRIPPRWIYTKISQPGENGFFDTHPGENFKKYTNPVKKYFAYGQKIAFFQL